MRLLFILCLLTLTACSTTNEDTQLNYRTSEITPTLEIPPDLTQITSEQNLEIPGSKVGKPENSGRYVETGNLNIEARTLPRIKGISIQGQGDLHWLEVPQKAEALYPLIRNFWAEQGFRLSKDEPAVGVMETEWLSVRSGSGSFLSSILESMKAADTKDQYKTRLERSSDDTSSLVFLAHRGQELIIEDTTQKKIIHTERSSGWQMMPADPAKEYEMLQRLMIFLGMQDEQVKQELEKIGLFAARARVEFDEADEATYLLVTQGIGQTWNRLLLQLDRLSIEIQDREKADNRARVKVASAALQVMKQADNEEGFRDNIYLSLESGTGADQTRIDVLDEGLTQLKSEQARQILQQLQQQLK